MRHLVYQSKKRQKKKKRKIENKHTKNENLRKISPQTQNTEFFYDILSTNMTCEKKCSANAVEAVFVLGDFFLVLPWLAITQKNTFATMCKHKKVANKNSVGITNRVVNANSREKKTFLICCLYSSHTYILFHENFQFRKQKRTVKRLLAVENCGLCCCGQWNVFSNRNCVLLLQNIAYAISCGRGKTIANTHLHKQLYIKEMCCQKNDRKH